MQTRGTYNMGVTTKVEKQTLLDLQQKTSNVFMNIHNSGDHQRAKKLAQLLEKINKKELTIAFCGHFSAGKSTFINELLQEQVLPSSPIPTSANVVTIKKGKEKAIVQFFEDEPLEILPPVEFSKIKEYCKAGDQVESVLYQFPFQHLDDSLVILDTPGIDSTDDAHRVSTESALHLADVTFYVMDYNHVQSEVNLQFIKDLQQKGKKLYLIINQIDKHQENELPFSVYKKRILQSLHEWNIEQCTMFFTSLKQQAHPLNELKKVKLLLSKLLNDKETIVKTTIKMATETIINEHIEWQYENEAERLDSLKQQLDENKTLKQLQNELTEKRNLYNGLLEKQNKKQLSVQEEVQKILDNANITPYEMRELSKAYLQSMQKEFKVGLLFSKKKTEEERQKRETSLVQDIKNRVQTHVEKHVQEYMLAFIEKEGITNPTWMQRIQTITIAIDRNFIEKHVKNGAGDSGDAVLNFTKDLASSIRKEYKNITFTLMNECFKELEMNERATIKKLKTETEQLEKNINAQEHYEKIVNNIQQTHNNLLDMLGNPSKSVSDEELKTATAMYASKVKRQVNGDDLDSITVNQEYSSNSIENLTSINLSQKTLADTITNLNVVSEQISMLPPFKRIAKELKERSNRLNNQKFTVALFGAFSAGKSSFANALFGEKVLPVSPNPTTASINKISPVTAENSHGTVHVKMKTEQHLLQDVQLALSIFRLQASTLEEAKEVIKSLESINIVDPKSKPHISFLQAFAKGYSSMKSHIGNLLTISLNEFEEYVATEEKACFVEWIEVFYDCHLTQQGITIVDTPGADSVNARHTEVSFEYIKNSDAILFVTYYQHAFSKADREFLIQLGRVKDAFSLDKMFFIINAADLANTAEELQLVKNYVGEQLLSYGIRNPRLFALSSLHGLAEKNGDVALSLPSFMKDSQLPQFENAFYRFIEDDLVHMSINAAEEELKRIIVNVETVFRSAQESDEEKKEKLKYYRNVIKNMLERINQFQVTDYKVLLEKEIKELLYYVNQRLFLRYREFFKEAFNPSVLRDDLNIKEQLQSSFNELFVDMEHDLTQEVRATTVRLEKYISTTLNNYQHNVKSEIQKLDENCNFALVENNRVKSLTIQSGLKQISDKEKKNIYSFYRNSKSFFEKNEKEKMRDYMEEVFQPVVEQFLLEQNSSLAQYYCDVLDEQFYYVQNEITKQVEEYYDGIIAGLSQDLDMDMWSNVLLNIKKTNEG